MIFQPKTSDYVLSPYTGLTRESFIEAAEYLLEGIFCHVAHFEDPVVMPRKETKITYPHLDAPKSWQAVERMAERFEGLARSFFIAAPLLHEKPSSTLCGYPLAAYYKSQILRSCTKGDALFVGSYETLREGSGDSYHTYQQTVETAALVIGLWECREVIWETYTQTEKDVIAAFLSGFAHGATVPQNWRLFNMLDLAFLHREGYSIDEEIMADHAQAIFHYYAGDGWYRDGQSFDYYSCWAFQTYVPIWNLWYGYEHMPGIAQKLEERSRKLMETYPDFFDRDGLTNMWGRSNIYRNASTSAFGAHFFLKNPCVDPGLARRICSGSLLQFLKREDFLSDGIPNLGFYGQFAPLIQGYSCAESPFWLGKAFLCLHLPKDHPFWTEKENNGVWEKLPSGGVKETVLNGPALCFSNHGANGATILRTGKVLKAPEDIAGMWNYAKLAYHTQYPWEACKHGMQVTPAEAAPIEDTVGGKEKGLFAEAMQYVLRDDSTGEVQRCNATFWCGVKEGVLYRRQFFHYDLSREMHWMQAVTLADFSVEYGLIRADRLKLYKRPITLTLGAYGFPDNGTELTVEERKDAKAIILKGRDFCGREKQLAMTVYDGWDDLAYENREGTNPDSERSIVVYARTEQKKQYGGEEPYVLISQVITKESHEDFLEEELFPIEKIEYEDGHGAWGAVDIYLKNCERKRICYEEMEGNLSL